MIEQNNKIPIKGYATFDPLKHCWIGSGFKAEWFHDLPIYKNNKNLNSHLLPNLETFGVDKNLFGNSIPFNLVSALFNMDICLSRSLKSIQKVET